MSHRVGGERQGNWVGRRSAPVRIDVPASYMSGHVTNKGQANSKSAPKPITRAFTPANRSPCQNEA
jgi:hypothetical protein